MKHWELGAVEARPHVPVIVSSTPDARAIVLALPAGERLQDHQVHERAWLVIIEGEVEVTAGDEEVVVGGPGLLFEFDPQERHEVAARSDTRLLLLLTPWPGVGHPGALSLKEKDDVRAQAAAHASSTPPARS